jgi:carboxypeptidase PM20D1
VKRAAAAAGIALALLLAALLGRAAMLRSRQLEVPPAPPIEVDADAVARHLALVIRQETVSRQDRNAAARTPLRRLHGVLRTLYGETHRALRLERVNDLSLLYTWEGRDPSLRPVLFAAHLDVVPIDAADEAGWTHPPFAGVVEDGAVWGRGAIDDKGSVVCLLEAVELLLAEGFQPERDVLLAFGHDEELGGDEGALRMAELLARRGVELEWVVDEGGFVGADLLPQMGGSLAAIGVAEKGSVSVALELKAPGGHSSMPPPQTAIGEVAAALVALERHPMPAGIDGVTAQFLDHLAPELPFPARMVLANRWFFGPLLGYGFSRVPELDAFQRTTTAVTMFEAGVKENVLPTRARAVVNFRIHPRDRVETVAEHVRRTIDDERIEVQVGLRTPTREPSAVSPSDSDAFRSLARAVRSVFPSARVVPYLVVGGTDSRHYEPLSPNVFRFYPFELGRETARLIHGTDEHISVENLARGVRFYVQLLREAAGPVQPSR